MPLAVHTILIPLENMRGRCKKDRIRWLNADREKRKNVKKKKRKGGKRKAEGRLSLSSETQKFTEGKTNQGT